MATPEATLKKLRLRDAKIVVSWARAMRSVKELAEKYHLTERRVQQIIYNNHDFVKLNKEKEKAKRVNILNRLIESKKEYSSRDVTELLEAQRKEFEGDGSSGGGTKVIIIRESNGSKNQRGPVPGPVSVIRV